MAEEQTPADRLRETWVEMGLSPDASLSQMQLDAFEVYREWWAGADGDEVRQLRAVQILMLPTGKPGVHKLPEFAGLATVLSEKWTNVGTAGEHVRFVQAMIMAAWNEGPARRRRFANILRPIASRFADAECRDVFISSSWQKPRSDRLSLPKKALDSLKAASNAAQIRDTAHAALVAQGAHIRRLSSRNALNLLWWGQARYCDQLEATYRDLTPGQQMYWSAYEASSLGLGLRPAAVASYLVEVWIALGLSLQDSKSLGDWLADVAPAVQAGAGLQELTENGAAGLPVCWLSVQPKPVDALPDTGSACLVDSEMVLTRQDWASWLVAESMVEQLI